MSLDNFRHFIQDEKVKELFNIDENIHTNLNILKGSLKISNITTILALETNHEVYTYPNELTQVFINIINNSKDALDSNNIVEKYIFISTSIEKEKLHIKIQDNANGIPIDIINKVFEPYFTTKHKSQGTGLGLYMSYKIITERLKGEIFVNNITFKHDNNTFYGAQFNIILPLDNI